MDKETLLKICDRIYNDGFEIGWRDAWAIEHGLESAHILTELKNNGFEEEKTKQGFLDDEMKASLKKSRIEKVLKKYGVDTEEEKND